MINNRFENYLISEREEKFQRIYYEINQLYIDNNYKLDPMELIHYALAEDINIIIKDTSNKIIYNSNTRRSMGMMGGMHHGHMGHMGYMHRPEGKYIEKEYPLTFEGDLIGTLIIGYIDNAYLTESAMIFKGTLFRSFILSGFVTILIGLIFSIVISNRLTQPLVSIKDTANAIKAGNLQVDSEVKTDVKEIIELSEAIGFLGNTLAEQEDIRKRYASDISHELRTPLTTLRTHLEAIIDGVWEPTREHLQILMEEIQRLSNLVDNLRDSFTETEYSIKLNKERFNISKELEAIITAYVPIYEKKGFTILGSIEPNIEVYMDKDKFKQIINNLLSNSLRYLEDEGQVFVDLKENNRKITIKVKDNGIGIKDKDLPHIFNRFYRVDTSRQKSTGGSGLGLSIVKSMVEAHGGYIYVESQYGKGTEFTLNFPLKQT